jgi:predicted membrane channel-forming protein YqfA (hemolysin III family)
MILKALDAITMVVLLAVAAVLGWMIAASFAPEAVRWASTQTEVIVILILLTAALLLVSAVALWHARPRDLP